MSDNPDHPQRKHIRLPNYDYATPSAYFITICTQSHIARFGTVVDDKMQHNAAGEMIETQWLELSQRFSTIELDAFVVMPNHFHGIIILDDSNLVDDVGAGLVPARTRETTRVSPTGNHGPLLGNIIGAFKSLTTNAYIRSVKSHNWPPFHRRLWKRNYYEHIIRSDQSYQRIWSYIADNPRRWAQDRYHPDSL